MEGAANRKVVPVDLARAGEARHFISWRAAVAGLGGGRLGELATAAEAVLTDIFLSAGGGVLEIESEHDGERVRITVHHPELPPDSRKMSGLPQMLEQFLDGHELSPERAVLVKSLR